MDYHVNGLVNDAPRLSQLLRQREKNLLPSPDVFFNFFRDPGLIYAFGLVLLMAIVSLVTGLKLEADLIYSTLRGFLQLSLVGFALIWIFSLESFWIIAAVLLVMTLLASRIAQGRGRGIPHVFPIVALALGVSMTVTLSLLVLGKSISAESRILIPLGGMLLGNSMNGAGLTLNRLKTEMELRRSEILVYLSLGASSRQSVHKILQEVLRTSLIPAVDTMKVLGVISIPGMMAGMIVAGKSARRALSTHRHVHVAGERDFHQSHRFIARLSAIFHPLSSAEK